MGGAFNLLSEHPRTVFSAGVASLALHGSFLLAVFGGTHTLTAPTGLSPLRFSGQTFDVDALSEFAENGSPSSSPAAPSGNPPPQVEPRTEPQESSSPPSTDDKPSLAPTLPQPDPGAPPPKAAASNEKRTPQPESSEPSKNPGDIDPFDLAQLPGEPVSADALPPARAVYGAESTPTGVIDVFAAFLRKFPEAAKNEPSWETLAPGFAGRIEFVVTLEKGERGLTLAIDDSLPAPSHLESSVLRTTNYLRYSSLAWRDGASEGTQRLSLSARVERRQADSRAPYSRGILAFGIHGEHQPNSAFFTYASGQHIEIELRRIP